SLFPEKMLETSDDFVWKVVGSDQRNIPLVEARAGGSVVQSNDTGVGAARAVLEFVFAEKYFSKVHVIAGMHPDLYQFRVLADPDEEGGNYVYKVEVWGGEETLDGVPGTELVAGNRFSIESAYVEDEL